MSKEKREAKLLCPCCDYLSLSQWAMYQICRICFWENDGLDVDQLEVPSPANHNLTLAEARDNFKRVGACSERWQNNVCSLEERLLYKRSSRVFENLDRPDAG